MLLSEYKELRRKYYEQHLWGVGYFCRSVGTVTKDVIKEYIENQQDKYEENFKNEKGITMYLENTKIVEIENNLTKEEKEKNLSKVYDVINDIAKSLYEKGEDISKYFIKNK